MTEVNLHPLWPFYQYQQQGVLACKVSTQFQEKQFISYILAHGSGILQHLFSLAFKIGGLK